jgi:adenylate cyclase
MKISAFQKIKITRLLIVIVSWTLLSVIFFIYEYYAIRLHAPETASDINLSFNIFINMYAGILAGVLGGPFLIFSVSQKTRNQPFYYGILYTAIGFIVVYIIVSFSISLYVFSINLKSPIYSGEVIKQTLNNLLAIWQIKNVIIWTVIITTTQFILQINDKFGPGNMWRFIRGVYYNPKEEERIFMFLDLKSSTSIAEKIGHVKYYNLLNDFYATITDPIINHLGNIYQYVGDEVIISWGTKNNDNIDNCLACFFSIKENIYLEKNKFINRYGLIPEFKAGIHCGIVTVGEIGVMKRDIVYSGDVLNTTSRIQEACNDQNAELLISEDVINQLKTYDRYQIIPIGELTLKGKLKKIKVSSVKEIQSNN